MRTSAIQPPIGTMLNHSHPLAQGLVGCWLLNEGGGQIAFDSTSLNNIPGSLKNGAVFKRTTRGNAVVYDGSDDYVDAGSNSNINPLAVSISTWVKFDAFTHSYNACVSKVVASTAYYQILVKSTGKLALYTRPSGANVSYDPGNITLSTGVWYNLVLTYSAQDGLKGYVNGVLDSTAAANGTLVSNTAILSFGTDLVAAGRQWAGVQQDVKIWNRALSLTEVRQLYAQPYCMFQGYQEKNKNIYYQTLANLKHAWAFMAG